MKRIGIAAAVAAGLLTALAATSATADPVTWTFQGVTLADGGTVSGSFTYDADAGPNGSYSNVNVVTAGGSQLPGATYVAVLGGRTGGDSFANAGDVSFVTAGGSADGQTGLFLDFNTNLTNAGGNVTINPTLSSEATCLAGGFPCGPNVPGRLVSAGSLQGVPVAPVPTLSEWAMIILGSLLALGAMTMIARRRLLA
jgi:hypothetical protein